MSVGFGFSAGDFIAALDLVATVIDALRDSGDSSTEYRELISQLFSLETALRAVEKVELDDVQIAEVIALQQAAAQCQRTIDAFWEKIKKYQPSLGRGTGSRVRDGWMKIKWALCRKEDLVRFKADLVGHTESIEMLLTTVQMAATRIDSKKNDQRHQTLAGRLQDSYFGCMQRIGVVLERVSTGIQQGKQILEMTSKIIQTNVQIFQILVSVQNVVSRIPGQVERQKPVYFIDALDRHMAFHLEFVLSAEALTAVLRSNFRNVGHGAKKIERGEFVIQDSATKRDVNLAWPWESCFRPGQCVAMSMIFNSSNPSMACPNCQDNNGDNPELDKDIECQKCKMSYRRSVSITSIPSSSSTAEDTGNHGNSTSSRDPSPNSKSRKRAKPHDEEKEMALFRRVRIKTELKVQEKPKPKPTTTQSNEDDDDDPYFDPETLLMLEAEKAQETLARREWEAEMLADIEQDRRNEDLYYEDYPQAEYELWRELQNEADVEDEINQRMMREELPSDSDSENTESHDSDSDGMEDSSADEGDIDMDYRFS